jgi:hypothetical protein
VLLFPYGKTQSDYGGGCPAVCPYLDGVLMWNVYGYYQSNADIKKEEWNHIKMVISGSQMRMYVNNSVKLAL